MTAGERPFERLTRHTGVAPGTSDLWCTYAAVRTLGWLGRLHTVADPEPIGRFLVSRRNSDGGFAWMSGMASDAWATFYCTQALAELGIDGTSPRTLSWVLGCQNEDGGFGMAPGQESDPWATYYCTRTLRESLGAGPERPVNGYLRSLQGRDGGLCWTPRSAAEAGPADVRACYYGVVAARTLGATEDVGWDRDALVAWLRSRQTEGGAFTFTEGDTTDCMWATFRAVLALDGLDAAPADPGACRDWVLGRRTGDGSFTRWPGYPVPDVWAAFCAVGALRVLGPGPEPLADAVAARIARCRIADAGFTYREPDAAADVLTTAAAVLSSPDPDRTTGWVRWMEGCVLPNEGGVMYMPARGSEVRCTLWALSAGAFADDPPVRAGIGEWLTRLQIRGSAFGYWEGRGADIVSTAAAVDILTILGRDLGEEGIGWVLRFVAACRHDAGGYSNVPGAEVALRAGLQACRIRRRLGGENVTAEVAALLDRHRVRGGGYANTGNRLPDLLSTYESVRAADEEHLGVDADALRRFLDGVQRDGGTGWTPISPAGGQLADTLATLLRRRVDDGRALPALVLS